MRSHDERSRKQLLGSDGEAMEQTSQANTRRAVVTVEVSPRPEHSVKALVVGGEATSTHQKW